MYIYIGDVDIEVEPHGTHEIGMFKLIVEGPEVDNTADTPNPLGIYMYICISCIEYRYDDVTNDGFLKLWDLLRYSEIT